MPYGGILEKDGNTEIPDSGISSSVSVVYRYQYRTCFCTSFGIAYRYRNSGVFGSVRYRYPSLGYETFGFCILLTNG